MNYSLGIKTSIGALVITILSGCTVPVVRIAPPPTTQQLALDRQVQLRVIAIPVENVFPKVLDVLMDNGFIVRSANERIGFVSFYQQWKDTSQHNANITLEGSIIFNPVGPNSTQARLLLTGSWQLNLYGSGDSVSSMVGSVQQSIPAKEYAIVLDAIDHGLAPVK